MGSTYNIDYQKKAKIITNPVNEKGIYGQILCLTNCSGVNIIDQNLTDDSEQWSDNEFVKGAIIVGLFKEITLTGRVVLYA